MASFSRRSRRSTLDIWPGFVDALATLLLVIIFVLLVFVLAQFFLGQALSGRDKALDALNRRIVELGQMLDMERKNSETIRLSSSRLSTELQSSLAERDVLARRAAEAGVTEQKLKVVSATAEEQARQIEVLQTQAQAVSEEQANKFLLLQNDVAALEALKADLEQKLKEQGEKLAEQGGQISEERRLSEESRAQAALLARQMAALKEEISRLNAVLEASEQLSKEQDIQIIDLGKRLNAALASKVEELSRYRSEFFGRLRQILGETPGIRIEGDRFVFQSELLFASGSADLGEEGQAQIARLATTLHEITRQIPSDINWILRVDGHTDVRPINTARFSSNWELSAARAISVVKFLESHGIPPERLAATGFGEYQPIDKGTNEQAYNRNRRIEFRLDQR